MDSHSAALNGAKPKYFDIFTDFTGDPSTWAASAGWAAWSSAMSGNAYVGPGSGIVPVVGIPLATNALGFANVEQFYIYTISGKYDAVYAGVVDAWADAGYKTVDFRIAYEMNGSFMPWSPYGSNAPVATAQADLVRAFQRVAGIIHAEAKAKGIKAFIHWNPAAINWTPSPVSALYPGDAYIDVISIDQYNIMFPLDYTDWSTGGTVQMTDKNAWATIAANRAHYWRYPNATQYLQTPSGDDKGWSWPQAIAFAKLHKKPLSVDETGAGSADNGGLYLADDPEFPKFLALVLKETKSKGVVVRSVNIWDAKVSDGDWNFRSGGKPLSAAAWKTYFGEPIVVTLAALTIGQGLSAPGATIVLAGGSDLTGWSKASAAAPITARMGAGVYAIIGAANGQLTLSSAAVASDVAWGGKITAQ